MFEGMPQKHEKYDIEHQNDDPNENHKTEI